MRAKTLQIYWHDKKPVFALDFDNIVTSRFASCGGDTFIRIWSVGEAAEIKYLSTLARHSSGVNCVRWSPVASHLASAGDDGTVLIWEESATPAGGAGIGQQADEDEDCLEHWKLLSTLRGSNQEVYDIAWSPDGSMLAAGGMDGCVRIFDVIENMVLYVLADHHHFVQGVAIDPLFEYIASQSNDRAVHVYKCDKDKRTHPKLIAKHNKVPSERTGKLNRLYHDEEVNSFFRRLAFCPDGSLLVTPTGISISSPSAAEPTKPEESSEAIQEVPAPIVTNTVYVYSRGRIMLTPFAHLPGHKKPAIAVRFSPIKYELIDDGILDEEEVDDEEIVGVPVEQNPKTTQPESSSTSIIIVEAAETSAAEPPKPIPACLVTVEGRADVIMETAAEALFEPIDSQVSEGAQGKYSEEGGCMDVDPVTILQEDDDDGNAEMNDASANSNSESAASRPVTLRSIGRKNYEESSTEDEEEQDIAVPVVSSDHLQPPTVAASEDAANKKLPPLSYRYIYAVATLDSVTIYSTQKSHTRPIAYLSNLHYAPLTDIAWNKEGTILLMSSTDGYCTLVEFEGDELGTPVVLASVATASADAPVPAVDPTAIIVDDRVISSSSTQVQVLENKQMPPLPPPVIVAEESVVKAAPIVANTLSSGLIKKRISPTLIRPAVAKE